MSCETTTATPHLVVECVPEEDSLVTDNAYGFSLVDEPWVQVLTTDGEIDEVSLRKLFARATEIREVVGDLPTQAFAIIRLALAILHRAVDGPADIFAWRELWDAGVVPIDDVEDYLAEHRDRFDLFHPTTPFFQVPDLRTAKGGFSGLEKLVADVPAGHPYFTTRIGRGLERLTPAEAARWLVHLQAYDVSGIKSGAVGDDRVKGGRGYPIGTGWAGAIGGILVEGNTLWQTLLLNFIATDQHLLADFSEDDRPAWEAPPSTAAQAGDLDHRPYGPLDLYTWQARRVRLIGDRSGVTAVLVANGDKITPQNRHRVEPMTAWRRSIPQQQALKIPLVYMPRAHNPARALWRGLGQLLPLAAPRGKADAGQDSVAAGVVEWAARRLDGSVRIELRGIGMTYGTQNAVVEDVFDDRLTLSVALLGQQRPELPRLAIDAVESTEAAVLALRNLASNLAKAGGAGESQYEGARARAAERAYAALDPPFRRWLSELGPESDIDTARIDWHREAWRILRGLGEEMVAATGPDAWVGRVVGGRRITSPEAYAWFRAALIKVLPIPDTSPPAEETTA